MNPSNSITVLGISGSLRLHSSNGVLVQAAGAALKAKGAEYLFFEGMDALPLFSPDVAATEAVSKLRNAVAAADAVIIGTPEYAFGVPGVLKNALDWLVSTGEFNEKPVVAISSSSLHSGGDKALASLLLTLKALGTVMDGHSSISIGSTGQKITGGVLTDDSALEQIKKLMDHLLAVVSGMRQSAQDNAL